MSTEYDLNLNGSFHVSLTESSSTVSLDAFTSTGEHTALASRMDARELARIGLEFLKVASYLDGDLDSALLNQDSYIISELKRSLKEPNAATIAALEDSQAGRVTSYSDLEQLQTDLANEDDDLPGENDAINVS